MKTLIITLFYILFANFASKCRGNEDSGKTYRLVNNRIFLKSYDLHITPDLEPDFKFTGKVSMQIYVYANTDYFTLNSKNLQIKDIKVYSRTTTYATTYELIPEKEMLKIHLTEPVYARDVTIDIVYAGKINDDFKGFFKVQYNEDNSKKWLLATQLQPTYARMVFPCFDEPEYRASYTLTVFAPTDQRVLSLTDVNEEWLADNRRVFNFYPTIPIPTYTISIMVHKFNSLTREANSGRTTLYSRPHDKQHSDYFLSEYQKWFTEMENYFEVYFKDHSMDVIAIPDTDNYLSNAGLFVYKESDVFHVEGIDADQHREEIARVSIHKLTHLWFSIFTTIKWWDNTWLCESFAVFFEYLISAKVQPTWKMEDRFLLDVVQSALFEEEYISDTSLSSPTAYPGEIQDQKFNSFINKKGASIIAMLQNVVTDKRLKEAIHQTLSNARTQRISIEPNDFWYQLQNQISNDKQWPKDLAIQAIMDLWTSNHGYPLITVTTKPQGTVVIEQEEYRSPRSLVEIPSQSWIVPITCTTQLNSMSTNGQPTIWLLGEKKVTPNIVLKPNEWILCNLQQTGYYRVHYTEKNWALLVKQLNDDRDKIHVRSRAQLIDDSFHLAIYNKLRFSTAFQLGTYLKNEDDMLPWLSIMKFATHLLQMYEQTPAAKSLKNYFGSLFKEKLEKIGFYKKEKENYAITTGRPSILKLACHIGVQNCMQPVAQIYKENLEDLTKVPADQKYVVYCNSFQTSDNKQDAWNRLWKIYEKSQIMSERQLILESLACANDKILLKKYINMALKPDLFGLYKCEKDLIIKSLGQSSNGVTVALEAIAEMLPEAKKTQSQDTIKMLISISSQTSSNVQSTEHLAKLKQMITKIEMNDKKDEVLFKTLKDSYSQGLKTIVYRNNNAKEIITAVYKSTGYLPTSSTTQPPVTEPQTEKYSEHGTTSYSTIVHTSTPASSANYVLPTQLLYIILIIKLAFNRFIIM